VVYKKGDCEELFDRCGFLSRLGVVPGRESIKIGVGKENRR
jgi:hypothetical protein